MSRTRRSWRRIRHVWRGAEKPGHLSVGPKALVPPTQFQKSHHLIDPYHKVIYCYVAKNACSSFKFHFLRKKLSAAGVPMSDVEIDRQKHGLHKQHAITEVPDDLFKDYYVFFIVRHPSARICSAFLDKFVHKPTLPSYARQFMVNGGCGDDPALWTFTDFVHCIARAKVEELNEHWMPQHRHIIEGIDYDFIPMESFAKHPRLKGLYGDLTHKVGGHGLSYFDAREPAHLTPVSELRRIHEEHGAFPAWRSFMQPELEDILNSAFGPDFGLYQRSKTASAPA